jgi:hypothetical protein
MIKFIAAKLTAKQKPEGKGSTNAFGLLKKWSCRESNPGPNKFAKAFYMFIPILIVGK